MRYRLQKLSALALCLIMLASILLPVIAVTRPKMELHTFTSQSYLSSGAKIVAGDINGDNAVNNKDLIRFLKYLSGWSVTVNANPDILDVNGDGKINNKDLLRLLKFLSKWNVEIFPKVTVEKALFNAYDYLTDNQKGIYNLLDAGVANLSEEYISIKSYLNKETYNSDIRVAFFALRNDKPEYFWIPRNYLAGYSYNSYTGEILDVCVSFAGKYKYNATEKATMSAALEAKVNEIVTAANAYATDYEKELYVHDYLCELISYDDTAASSGNVETNPLPWTAYGALINGNCVCEGYSRAMQLICQRLNIPCSLVSGDADGPHMWNIIKIGGETYYLDVTHDDLDNTSLTTACLHGYFNVTKTYMLTGRTFDDVFDNTAIYGDGAEFNFFDNTEDNTQYYYYNYTGVYLEDENDIDEAVQYITDCHNSGITEYELGFADGVNLESALYNIQYSLYFNYDFPYDDLPGPCICKGNALVCYANS